ncbi:MAG: hypothetical protein H0X28_05675 [Solirubrobacterales bacterium]|nr:hypothetical protein [Solirubrobacterales bacterium]
MSQGFDELERQLKRAVRARRHTRSTWMRHGHRRTWAFVAIAMLAISAGAFAATRLVGGKSATTQGDELAVHAVIQTAHLPACQLVKPGAHGLALTEGTLLAQITDVLPSLSTPVSASEQAATLRALARSRVEGLLFARTLRTIPVSPHLELLVAVGPREETVRDPAVCAHARLARAEELARNRPVAVLRRARWRLGQDRATAPGVQTLFIYERPVPLPRGELAGGGGSDPIWSGHPLKPGIPLVSGRRDGSRLFIGIAAPNTTHIRVKAHNNSAMHGLPSVVPVVEGFFAVTVPRGTGRFGLLELAADGSVLRPVNLRQ